MLRQTPAPFLNRFEKYYVSLSDVLEREISSIENEDYKRTIKYALAGCRQMARRFKGNYLFFGYVEGETLESIFIQMVRRYKRDGVLKPLLSFQSMLHRVASPIQEPNEEYGVYLIQETMKRVFQTARPESMISNKDELPEDCMEEYFLHQEHFSVAQFIKSVLRDPNSGNKWCIFTKAVGIMKALCSDSDFGKKVRSSLFGMERKASTDDLYAFALEDILSSDDWDTKGSKIDQASVVACAVDMQLCTADQVNVVREYMNKSENDRKRFFLIMHFPLELSVLHSYGVGQTIFADGWNYQYVESLGLKPSGEQESGTKENLMKWVVMGKPCETEFDKRVKNSYKALSGKNLSFARSKSNKWYAEWKSKAIDVICADAESILRGEKHMGLLSNIDAMFNSFCFEKAISLCSGNRVNHNFIESIPKSVISQVSEKLDQQGVFDENVRIVCEKMDGSALFLALHALHPLVSYAYLNGISNQNTIAENMLSLCGLELDEELEELGKQNIRSVGAFMEEITRRIETLSYLFKDINANFNAELNREDSARLYGLWDTVKK